MGPGDGNDVVEGEGGVDTLIFNGSNANEIFDVSANGARVRLVRNVGNIVMDLNGVEKLTLNALGGVDSFTVNDLTGTDLTGINANLASTLGGSTGDAQADVITVNGTASLAKGGTVEVSGLAALLLIRHPEVANDRLIVNGLGGVDTITTGPGVTALIGVTIGSPPINSLRQRRNLPRMTRIARMMKGEFPFPISAVIRFAIFESVRVLRSFPTLRGVLSNSIAASPPWDIRGQYSGQEPRKSDYQRMHAGRTAAVD